MFSISYLPDIPVRRKDEVNATYRIIRFPIKVILILGAAIRLPALSRVSIDIQVPARPFVNGAAPTVTALENQKHLAAGVREVADTNGILQFSGQIAIGHVPIRCQQFLSPVIPQQGYQQTVQIHHGEIR